MNIKNIKALKENEVYPKWYLERGHDNVLFEDMPPEKSDRCMPYYSYPIPRVEDLCMMIDEYVPHTEIDGKQNVLTITSAFSELGTMFYTVSAFVHGVQDWGKIDTSSPFLDDALAEALLYAHEQRKQKTEYADAMEKEFGCPDYKGNYYCLGEKDCTLPDDRHECHPKG